MSYTYSHQGESLPHVFLTWLKQNEYELSTDDCPQVPLATLENAETVDLYFYNRSDIDLGLEEWSGIVALNDKGYVAKLGLRDRNFKVLEEAENIATDEELVDWLDNHATLASDSPIYWNNEVLMSVLKEWCEENSEYCGINLSIELPPESAWWKDPEDPFALFYHLVNLPIQKPSPISLWITQLANGLYMVCNEQTRETLLKMDYSAVEEYLDTLM